MQDPLGFLYAWILKKEGFAVDMNIQKYAAFLKTVEYGSFTKAAESLSYSQSGISRMIADLEKEWEVSLLERGRGGVRLTSDGITLLPYVKRLCMEYGSLQRQVNEMKGLQTGLIRIGTLTSVATHWLPNIVRKFHADYPNIEYELISGEYIEVEEWILEGRVDCGFLRLPAHPDLETVFMERDELLVILPENHRLADCEVFPVEALCEDPFMLLEKGGRMEASELFEKYHLKPDVHFRTWDDYAIMSMVESGLGISIAPELFLRRTPYRIAKKKLNVPAYRDIAFALRCRKTASMAVKRFMEYLDYR